MNVYDPKTRGYRSRLLPMKVSKAKLRRIADAAEIESLKDATP